MRTGCAFSGCMCGHALAHALPSAITGEMVKNASLVMAGVLLTAAAMGWSPASDNRGHTDDHLPPGMGVIDWTAVESALDAARYRGVFVLEVTGEGELTSCLAGLKAWKERG
jgi:hypothetical protein